MIINLLERQDPRLAAAVQFLVRELPSARVFAVGGCVRDALLNIAAHDLDVEVRGVTAQELEDVLATLFPGCVNAVGRAFHVFKVRLADNLELDIALPRRESTYGINRHDFTVESDATITIEEALQRRDFTINSMAVDLVTGELVDPFGGARDLVDRVLRVTSEERFQDDELRVYRGVQFAARFGLTVEPQTLALMRGMVARGDLEQLPPERVTEELKKLFLQSSRPSIGLELMRDLGIIERFYPELHALVGTPQEPEWHPEGDVWIHTGMVVDEAAKLALNHADQLTDTDCLQLIIGAMCHDLGKPSTTHRAVKDGVMRWRSLGHEEAGVEPTQRLLSNWTFGSGVEQAAIAIARDHLKPVALYHTYEKSTLTEAQYANAVRKLVRKIHPVSWRIFLYASEADIRGRGVSGAQTNPFLAGMLFEQTILTDHLDQEPTKSLLSGEDVMRYGIEAGPQVGAYLQAIEYLRDEGELRTREEALDRLKQLVASHTQ